MKVSKNQIAWIIATTIVFYFVGRLGYEYFYSWTLRLVEYYSGGIVSFYGKFSFWFFGDPVFGLVFSSIPFTISLCCLLLKDKYKNAFRWTLIFYLPILIVCYLLNCYIKGIGLVASNDFLKEGQILRYHLSQVNINRLLFESIIVATVLTAIINVIKRICKIRRRVIGTII